MKNFEKWDKKYFRWGFTAFVVLAAAILFATIVWSRMAIWLAVKSVFALLSPVIIGFVFAYLLMPVAVFFETKVTLPLCRRVLQKLQRDRQLSKKQRAYQYDAARRTAKTTAIFLTILIFILAIVGAVSAVIPQLFVTVQTLVLNMNSYAVAANTKLVEVLKGYPDVLKFVQELLDNSTRMLMSYLQDSAMPKMNDLVSNLSDKLKGMLGVVFNTIMGFVISIYFIHGKERFAGQSKKLLYGFLRTDVANSMLRNLRQINRNFSGFISGKLIDSLIIGVIFFILLWFFKFPYTLLMAVVLGVTNVIPYFGPLIGGIPMALLTLLADPPKFLPFIILVLVVQQFDGNILGPKILGGTTGLSSFWVIFAILIGQGIFGFWGLIIGIPLFSVIYAFVKTRVNLNLDAKGLPRRTETYIDSGYIKTGAGEAVAGMGEAPAGPPEIIPLSVLKEENKMIELGRAETKLCEHAERKRALAELLKRKPQV